MRLFTSIATCFLKYVSVNGTANRSEFWFWLLFAVLVLSIATILDGAVIAPARGFLPFEHDAGSPLALATSLLLLAPTVTVSVRRLHDSAINGWWLLLVLTGLGAIVVAYWFLKKGKKEENPYLEE